MEGGEGVRYAQTATLRRPGGYNSYGEPIFGPLITVLCRKEPAAGVVRTSLGAELNAETYYSFPADVPVNVGDELDGSSVRYASTTVSTRGVVRGYEAAV